jgi:hypothetical protein
MDVVTMRKSSLGSYGRDVLSGTARLLMDSVEL